MKSLRIEKWKQLSLGALLLAAATMTACSSDNEDIAAEQQSETPITQKYTMTITATKGDDAATRGLALDGNRLNVKWNEGEVVEVYQLQNSSDTHLGTLSAAASETGSTTLTGTLDFAPISDQSIYFYMNNSYSKSYSDQNGVLLTADNATKSIEKDYDFAQTFVYPGAFTISDNHVTVPDGITLQSQQAIVKFVLKDASGNDLNATSLTVRDVAKDMQGGGSHISQSPLVVTPPTEATNVFYVAINGLDIADKHSDIVLTATTASGDIYTYTKEYDEQHPVYFEHGKYYAIQVKMTKQPTDLSMVDCAGNARTSRWTANCYMVHTAGKYKLPLVYGNAIKDGAANTVAYNPGGPAGTNYCANFVSHTGDAISDPWIKNNGITVTQAELLWQDAQGLVTAVGISEDGDYLTLTVGTDADTQEGNALVAAKTADGTIVWSWHIWVTKQTFATLTEVNTGSHTYQLTPVNLGWVGDATSAIGGYNTYYQWGRKDAFIPSNPIPSTGTDNTNHTVYDIKNNDVTTTAFSHTDDDNITIGGNIQHPTVHYRNTSTYGLCDTKYYNMWDAQQTSIAIAAATTKKTVYDPCPPGFCVPTIGLYNYIKGQTRPAWNTGYTYSGVFFPASGYRISNSGDLGSVGSYGDYWSATPGGGTNGSGFGFNSSSWYLSSNGRAMGCPVRAVAE